jgi:hypothetical protein
MRDFPNRWPCLLVTLLLAGCEDPAKDTSAAGATSSAKPSAAPKPSAISSASAAPSVTATAAARAAGAGSLPPGDPVTEDALLAIELPNPPRAPASVTSKDLPHSATLVSVDRNFKDGNDIVMGVRLIDCRSQYLRDSLAQNGADYLAGGDFKSCVFPGTDELKGHKLDKVNDVRRHLRAGNIAIIVGSGSGPYQKSIAPADLEAYLTSLDLDAIAKL